MTTPSATKLLFRQCPACGERNIVRDGNFTCALYDSDLPTHWNFTSACVNIRLCPR